MDTQLPAVYISDEIGCLSPMPISRNPRRSMDFLYGLFTGQKEGEESRKSSDVDAAITNQKVGTKDGHPRWQDPQGPGDRIAPRRPSQGPGDGRDPRRPSEGPADEAGVAQQSSKSMDFSQFQKAMLLSGAKLAPRADGHGEVKKMVPKLGKDHAPNEAPDSPKRFGMHRCLSSVPWVVLWALDIQTCGMSPASLCVSNVAI